MVGLAAATTGVLPGGSGRVAAECGSAAPSGAIEAHRGFAFDGVITAIDRHEVSGEGWLYGITMDVTEPLAGDPGETVTFDLGSGSCWDLQGDRYKVGDRLIVTATEPPIEPPTIVGMRYLLSALTWRYEWGDTWTLHGLADGWADGLAGAIRRATTRDAIVALVAPDALPVWVAPGAWSVALRVPGGRTSLTDVVAWQGGFVAIGWVERPAPGRAGGRRTVTRPVLWTSATGERWVLVGAPFPAIVGPDGFVAELQVFQGALYAVGGDGDRLLVWRSTDGRAFSQVLAQARDDSGPAYEGAEPLPLSSIGVAATADRLIVLGAPGGASPSPDQTRVWTTDDGRTWTRSTPEGLPGIDPIATADGFVTLLCACSGPTEHWMFRRSTDGLAWEAAGDAPVGTVELAWDASGTRYVAAVSDWQDPTVDHAAVDVSADGVSWTRLVASPGITGSATGVAVEAATVVLLGSGGMEPGAWTMTSRDGGATWTYAALPASNHTECVADVAIGTTTVVAVGHCRGGALAWVADR
ncbi:MAG: hypothetical protein IT200_15475 [Thermoleophilia bacterium]|nr:hypothetical protein [Thermoleophilia bacterium]